MLASVATTWGCAPVWVQPLALAPLVCGSPRWRLRCCPLLSAPGGFQRCSPPCGASVGSGAPLVVSVKHRLSAPDGASTGRLTNGWGVHPFRVAAIAAMGGCGHPVVLTPDGFVVDGVAAHRWWPLRWTCPRWVVSIVYPRDSGALRYPRPGGHPPCPGGEFTNGAAGPGRPEGRVDPRDSAPRTVGERSPGVPPGATGEQGGHNLSGDNPRTQRGELHEDGNPGADG